MGSIAAPAQAATPLNSTPLASANDDDIKANDVFVQRGTESNTLVFNEKKLNLQSSEDTFIDEDDFHHPIHHHDVFGGDDAVIGVDDDFDHGFGRLDADIQHHDHHGRRDHESIVIENE